MSIKTVKDALKDVQRDEFPEGTVIRWQSSGQYTYAALKSGAGWFTTAMAHNVYVPQRLTFDRLLEVLQRSETSEVRVATGWADPLAEDVI